MGLIRNPKNKLELDEEANNEANEYAIAQLIGNHQEELEEILKEKRILIFQHEFDLLRYGIK